MPERHVHDLRHRLPRQLRRHTRNISDAAAAANHTANAPPPLAFVYAYATSLQMHQSLMTDAAQSSAP